MEDKKNELQPVEVSPVEVLTSTDNKPAAKQIENLDHLTKDQQIDHIAQRLEQEEQQNQIAPQGHGNYPLSPERLEAFSELSDINSVKNYHSYLSAISKIQILTHQEETELAIRFQKHSDTDAARLLVLSNLRFVVHIANSFSGYGLKEEDLVQEGNIGLVKAVKLFDPLKKKKARLISFAVHWIKAEMQEYVLKNWKMVKVATTKQQRKLFYNLRSKRSARFLLAQDEASLIANDLGVSVDEVFEMEKRLSRIEHTYEETFDEDENSTFLVDSALQSEEDIATQVEQEATGDLEKRALRYGLGLLDERSRDIIQKRWLSSEKSTLQNLSETWGVSIERARQIEASAIKKLKKNIESYLVNPAQRDQAAQLPLQSNSSNRKAKQPKTPKKIK